MFYYLGEQECVSIREGASKRQSREGPRKGAPFSPPSPVVGSPRPPIAHVLFTISPKWRACSQALLLLIRQSFESEPHQDSPLWFNSRWPNNPFIFYCPKFPDNYYCKLLILLSLLLLRHNSPALLTQSRSNTLQA